MRRVILLLAALTAAGCLGSEGENEPNDSVADADGPFLVGTSVTGEVSITDDDYFAVELLEPGPLRVTVEARLDGDFCLGRDATLQLVDGEGHVLATDSGVNGCPRLAMEELPAGTYYVRVEWLSVFENDARYRLRFG